MNKELAQYINTLLAEKQREVKSLASFSFSGRTVPLMALPAHGPNSSR